MSGGVDSAVALLAAGDGAVGVTLRLWVDPKSAGSERVCCSPAAVIAARETCHRLGIPHVTLDLREEFRRKVVQPFTEGYARGETPNPCSRCNGAFRFDELLLFAEHVGASRLATGHYARIVEHDGRLAIARAADLAKDQSYMLATIDPSVLGRLWFPLGEQTKDETRAQAEAAGLAVAHRPESQEACFLGGDDYQVVPRAERARDDAGAAGRRERHASSGPTTDSGGSRPGSAAGSVSPRRSRSTPSPPSRARTRSSSAPGRRSHGAASRSTAGSTGARRGSRQSSGTARRRSTPPSSRPPGGFELLLDEPAFGVATGQTAVVYSDGAIVGAGVIVGSASE